jgi:hypothetical protein
MQEPKEIQTAHIKIYINTAMPKAMPIPMPFLIQLQIARIAVSYNGPSHAAEDPELHCHRAEPHRGDREQLVDAVGAPPADVGR